MMRDDAAIQPAAVKMQDRAQDARGDFHGQLAALRAMLARMTK
jgi:hypothetical protein